ncbi:MAG: acyl-[ACP]--phospholipid O-acyltransferase [Campylobacterota bacterium]|nr:acyl-[ACP]--phospholipid O-acyltransferase [Campylobacterota bacterium]
MKKLLSFNGFLPYILVVFLNAFTDLGHKIIIQNSIFKVYDGSEQVILTAIVNALMLLPFILLFTSSGFISDKYSKHKVMRISAIVAVLITLLITLSYYLGLFWIAFALTFALAIQSAIYSPAKYGYLKELVGSNNIVSGNGVVQSVTIFAILFGIFFYSVGFEYFLPQSDIYNGDIILQNIAPMGWFLVIGSLIELKLAYQLTDKSTPNDKKIFSYSKLIKGNYLQKNIKLIFTNKTIWLSIIGLSIFWGLSQVILAIFPTFAKNYLDIHNVVIVQGVMGLSAIGIIIGSLIASKISKEYIEVGLIPIGSIGIFLTILIIPFLDNIIFIGINFLLFGLFGGLILVPLNSLIQFNASKTRLGLILAGNNFVQNITMFIFLISTVLVTLLTIDVITLFYILAFISFLGMVYTIAKLPQSLIKIFISRVLSVRYNLIVQGIGNIPQTKGVLLLGNHISWLDWAFIQLSTPKPIRFVMEKNIYEKKLLKPFLDFFNVLPISAKSSKSTLKNISDALNNGDIVCIFPEGSISRTGHLGEFKKGFQIAAKDTDATIVPFYIGGMWGTRFSRSNINFRDINEISFTKDVIVSFGKAIDISSDTTIVKQKVLELSVDSLGFYVKQLNNIETKYINTIKQQGSKIALIDAISGDSFSYYKMFTLNIIFKRIISKYNEQNIGLLLPTTPIGAIMNMAIILAGKTVVNINYTSSKEAILSSVLQSNIKTIFTSKKFISKLKTKGVDISSIFDDSIKLVYLEDSKKDISKLNFISTYLFIRYTPRFILQTIFKTNNTLDTPAAILFSSGSEGTPKGVILTHKNILANIRQISEMLNITTQEIFLGSLPIFHAFGLTVTTLLPIVEGIKLVCYPDPTDAVGVGKAVARNKVTFMVATATFIRLYLKNKRVTPLMFKSLEMIFSGAEKLNKTIADEFKHKFGIDILEGYGATECSPLISANIPSALDTKYWQTQIGTKFGTVGMPLLGCAVKIIDPLTLEELKADEAGLIIVNGENVMDSYLNNPEKTKEAFVEIDERRWYKTGDKGYKDKDGFITIVDRYSRFAKLAGEMVSLTAVENKIYECLGDKEDIKLVCVNIPCDKKGEKIVLLIDKDVEFIKQKLLDFGIIPLWIPSEVKVILNIPVLGTGKINFKGAKDMVLEGNI